jgi:16S rRNA (adenine1518-N6/adenine1519-N6)-dimethyltransferase
LNLTLYKIMNYKESRKKHTGQEKSEVKRFITKKSLGQHFLTDARIARKIAKEGHIVPGETVLEIGPGTGNLTVELLAQGAYVVAVEADPRAMAELEERFVAEIASNRLTLRHGDIRTLSFTDLSLSPGSFKIVANIPYYISGFLFRYALENAIKPSSVVFLVQKEVAERIARSKKESLLSLGVKAYSTPRYCFTVKRGSFTPPPKVDSAVIAIENISRERLGTLPDRAFFEVLHEGFGSKRKQLFGLLKEEYGETSVQNAFTACNISPKARAEDIPIETWVALAHILTSP